MVFRRARNMRPINSIKHVVDSQNTVSPASNLDLTLVDAVNNPVSTTADNVEIGSRVSSIFLNIQVVNEADATGIINNFYVMAFLNPGTNIAAGNIPGANETGTSDFRKMIFHQEMVMLSDANDSIPITMFKGVLRIPKKAQRQGVNDKIVLRFTSVTGGPTVNVCVQCIYKEYR